MKRAPETPVPVSGAVICQVCSQKFSSHASLACHLRDKQDGMHKQFRSDPGSCEARGQEQEAAGAVKMEGIKKEGGAIAHCSRTVERRATALRATAAAGASAAHGTTEGIG